MMILEGQIDGQNSFSHDVALEQVTQSIVQEASQNDQSNQLVSFRLEVPEDLRLSMITFIERYPNWDQYRLIHAAIAGFLVQNAKTSRLITRLYIGNMFNSKQLINNSSEN